MKNHPDKEEHGFTLIELLIAMALALVIIAALSSAFVSQRKTYAVHEQISEMIQNARAAMDMISREVKMAGYDPTGVGIVGIPYNSTQLEIRADLNGDGDTSDSHEDIIYDYDSSNKCIDRSTQPFAENIQSFTFQYYDANGNTTTTAADIREIEITITARTAEPDPDYASNSGYRTHTLTSRVTPPNLGL
jgi:type IV pilus assembly protein PilW